MNVARHFLGWERDVVSLAAEFLARDWAAGSLDLDGTLALVPTRQAARRLRERLARLAAARGTGVLPPLVLPPDGLISLAMPEGAPRATPADEVAVWTDLLRRLDPRTCPALFPRERAWTREFAGCLSLARQFVALRALLGENGLLLRDVPARLAATGDPAAAADPARWTELARLEDTYLERLRRLGFTDPGVARAQTAAAPRLPPEVRRIVLLAVPDPEPLCLAILARLAETLPVEVCVHAPAALADTFDPWGRPLPEAWMAREVPLPDEAIRCLAKPGDQAEAVLAWMDTAGIAPADLAVGVPDETVVPHLQRLGERRGLGLFNPAGRPLASHGLYHLCHDLATLAVSGTYDAFTVLLRNPEFLAFVAARDSTLSPTALLGAADRFQNDCLPDNWPAAAARLALEPRPPAWAPLASVRRELEPLLARLRGPNLWHTLGDALGLVLAHRRLRPERPDDRAFETAATVLADTLATLDTAAVNGCCPGAEERLALLLHQLEGARCYAEPHETDLDVEGWLELAWNDAPWLALTGCNEGCVPESLGGHPFLPDHARRLLDLPHNDRRYARDVYLLQSMSAWRRPGRLLILFGKTSDEGDARRPSRLLFLCPDAQLPVRATRLFAGAPAAAAAAPRQLAWKLRPRAVPPPASLSVTAFRQYLACPYRFYLGTVLGMESIDDRKLEMDALDFGLVCHDALEDFARTPDLAASHDAARIATFLVERAEHHVERRYGRQLSAQLRVQLDAIRQRLTHAARIQAAHREAGWEILRSECRLAELADTPFLIDGMPVRGRIDRIDRHPDGRLLVLDYKTSDQPQPPAQTHLAPWTDAHPAPDFARVQADGRDCRWSDLQLPLYCLALRRAASGPVLTGYLNLPKAVTETRITLWPLDSTLLDSAEACAAGVVRAVRDGHYWPPAASLPYDDFAELFCGPAADAAEPPAAPAPPSAATEDRP